MPEYRLWQPDDTWLDSVHARDDETAVAEFSKQLGITLTLNEGPMVATYMMARRDSTESHVATWTKPPEIPVWVENLDRSN